MNHANAQFHAFCERYGLAHPILLAPMAGVSAIELSAAVAATGGMGALGALLMSPAQIEQWVAQYRATSTGLLQINLWIPDPPPPRDPAAEAPMRAFLQQWGPTLEAQAADQQPPIFDEQLEAVIRLRPQVFSTVMGVLQPKQVEHLKAAGIAWFAGVTCVREAMQAQAAGADAVITQGTEAGGHRAAFDAASADRQMIGLMALVPQVVDAVGIPVIAAGGIADGRGVAAALTLGASAVLVGTGLLRTPEAAIAGAWADAIGTTEAEDVWTTRGFSGRLGRAVATDFVRALEAPGAPVAAPYPVQRGLTAAMRLQAVKHNDIARIQAWCGQAGRLAPTEPAAICVQAWWQQARGLLGVA